MKTTLEMAREAGFSLYRDISAVDGSIAHLERFAALAQTAERNKLAAWMTQRGYATGHGDTVEDLLKEIEWQVAEREREQCAKVCEGMAYVNPQPHTYAAVIRARGQA